MAGMRKYIAKEETYNWYGDIEREIEIGASVEHGALIRALRKDVPEYEVCIYVRFVDTIKHKPLAAGHAKTDVRIDGHRRLDSRFCAKCMQEAIGGNSSSQKAHLRSLRAPYQF